MINGRTFLAGSYVPLGNNSPNLTVQSKSWFFTFKVWIQKSVNLKYITVGRLDDDMIVPPSDGAMFILIDWE